MLMRSKIIILILLLPLKGLFAQMYVSNGITLSVAAGEMLYSAGDVTVATGGIFGNAGTLQLAGNLSCQSAATAMNNLVFSGTAAQQYLGQPLQASNLTIANTAGLTLDAPVTVAAATTFASGLIASSAASPLIYASGASTGTVTDASHVNGPVQYNGMGSFTYPVGNTSYYRSVGITLDGNASGLTATYFSSASPASPLTAPLQAVSQQEY